MAKRLVLAIIVLAATDVAVGPAAALAFGLVMTILSVASAMTWSAKVRNAREREEFHRVNSGYAEPDPRFLMRVWQVKA